MARKLLILASREPIPDRLLEQDVRELYAPPDGYVDARTGAFSEERRNPDDVPVYEVVLEPEDGLYLLPYMARPD